MWGTEQSFCSILINNGEIVIKLWQDLKNEKKLIAFAFFVQFSYDDNALFLTRLTLFLFGFKGQYEGGIYFSSHSNLIQVMN